MAKSTVFFARKFEAAIDQSIMNRLEEQLTNSSLSYPGLDSYWECAYHMADLTPKTNHALLAVSISLAKHAISLLLQNSVVECSGLRPSRIIAITSYFRHDHYLGDLIHFEVDEKDVEFETLVKPLTKTTHFMDSPRILSTLQVGSDYDPKEQVLRNRLGVLSSSSKPAAIFKWTGHINSTTSSQMAHLVWFDPDDHVRAVHHVNVTDASKVNSFNFLFSWFTK
jgi:protein xylosyltransferase